MRRGLTWLVACLAVVASAASATAATVVLKQGVGGYAGCADTFIDKQSETTNYGSLWYLHLYAASHDPRRSVLVRFNLDGVIPPGSAVQSATLSLWVYQLVDMGSGDWLQVGPHRLRNYRDWVESQATWLVFKGTTYWATPGCESTTWDRYGTPDSYLTFYNTSSVNQYYHWNVTQSVQAWVGGEQNNGWLVRMVAHDGGTEGLSFNAKESAEAYRPYLTIVYDPPVSVEESTWTAIKGLFK